MAAYLVFSRTRTKNPAEMETYGQKVGASVAGHSFVPLVRYGDYEVNKKLAKAGLKRMFLHAHQLKFTHPMTNEPVQFTAPLPKALSQFLESISDEKTVSSLNL